jgi:hypothetical protein
MIRFAKSMAIFFAVAGLAAIDGSAYAQKDKGGGKDKQEQKETRGGKEDKGGGQTKPKKQKHENGKNLVGDKIKKNGKHELHKNGKHTAFVDVQDGKIRGVSVKHAEKGDVPVKKYKKVVDASSSGIVPVNLVLTQYMGTTYIGYSYYDDWGDEVIYWFPYDMIYDPYTDAVEYVPVY